VAFKIRQNAFPAGALPRTPLGGAYDTVTAPLVGWEGDTPLHIPPSALAIRPPEFQPDIRL